MKRRTDKSGLETAYGGELTRTGAHLVTGGLVHHRRGRGKKEQTKDADERNHGTKGGKNDEGMMRDAVAREDPDDE